VQSGRATESNRAALANTCPSKIAAISPPALMAAASDHRLGARSIVLVRANSRRMRHSAGVRVPKIPATTGPISRINRDAHEGRWLSLVLSQIRTRPDVGRPANTRIGCIHRGSDKHKLETALISPPMQRAHVAGSRRNDQ
jgi:hypothetical protein